MRRVLVGVGALFLVLGAAGCQEMGSGSSDEGGYSESGDVASYGLKIVKVPVEDGRTVTCVRAPTGAGGSNLSCDWVGYHASDPEK